MVRSLAGRWNRESLWGLKRQMPSGLHLPEVTRRVGSAAGFCLGKLYWNLSEVRGV
jgi:hypothetical protein